MTKTLKVTQNRSLKKQSTSLNRKSIRNAEIDPDFEFYLYAEIHDFERPLPE